MGSLLDYWPALTLSLHPLALAFELLVELMADGPELTGVFLHMKGLLSLHHPQLSTTTLYSTESHRAVGMPVKKPMKAGDTGQGVEPKLCQPAGRPGRSHLLHPWFHSLLR